MAERDKFVTRRSLLKLTAAAGVVGTLPIGQQALASNAALPFGSNAAGSASIHHWGAKDFEAYLDASFVVEAGLGRPLHMKLASIENFSTKDNKSFGECFALHFRLMEGTAVPQGTYSFEHRQLGQAAFLVVPSNTQPQEYTAVINHRMPR